MKTKLTFGLLSCIIILSFSGCKKDPIETEKETEEQTTFELPVKTIKHVETIDTARGLHVVQNHVDAFVVDGPGPNLRAHFEFGSRIGFP